MPGSQILSVLGSGLGGGGGVVSALGDSQVDSVQRDTVAQVARSEASVHRTKGRRLT